MSGGAEQPVPGQTSQKMKSTTSSSSDTTSATKNAQTGSVTQTLPDWMTQGLKSGFGSYLDTLTQFGNKIGDWSAAPFSADQLAAFDSARGVAGGAGGFLPASLDQLLATARGDYLYGGEGFNAAVEAAQRQAMPGVLSAFGRSGRDGGLAQVAMAQAFADPFAAQYGQERTRQLQASQLLPGMALMPSQILESIGKQYQQLDQYGRDGMMSFYPQLFGALSGLTGTSAPFLGQQTAQSGTSNTDQSTDAFSRTKSKMTGMETPAYFPGSSLAGGLGGALSGAGMGAQIGSIIPGIGTGIGAAAGGILGGIGGFF